MIVDSDVGTYTYRGLSFYLKRWEMLSHVLEARVHRARLKGG